MIRYDAYLRRDVHELFVSVQVMINQEENMHKTLVAALLIAAMGFATVGAYAADEATATTKETKTTKTEKKSKKAPKKTSKTEKTEKTTETK